jgi:hypothetical protein
MATKLIFQRLLVLGWEDALAVTIISSIYFVWTLQTYQGASMKQFNKGLEWKPQSALTSTVHDYVSPRSANICELLPSLVGVLLRSLSDVTGLIIEIGTKCSSLLGLARRDSRDIRITLRFRAQLALLCREHNSRLG